MAQKILVIDDDPDIVESLRITLESAGYDVVDANNAEVGLEKAKVEKPALIILDIMMPTGTEGFHFVWKLRSPETEEPLRDVPILVLTSIHETTPLRFYPEQHDIEYAPGEYLPVQEFVDKPIDPKEILKKVEKLLGTGAKQ